MVFVRLPIELGWDTIGREKARRNPSRVSSLRKETGKGRFEEAWNY